jgi:putative transposase
VIRSIFTAPDGEQARRRLADAVQQHERRLPKVAALLDAAEDDELAFYACPKEHWPKIRSTNPLGRFNREIGRRTDVVGIFPDDASVIRLVSMLPIEATDEWLRRAAQAVCAAARAAGEGQHQRSGLQERQVVSGLRAGL